MNGRGQGERVLPGVWVKPGRRAGGRAVGDAGRRGEGVGDGAERPVGRYAEVELRVQLGDGRQLRLPVVPDHRVGDGGRPPLKLGRRAGDPHAARERRGPRTGLILGQLAVKTRSLRLPPSRFRDLPQLLRR